MKPQIYFVVLFTLLITFCIVILQFPSPLQDFGRADVIQWLEFDRDIHKEYLSKAEDFAHNGTYQSHQKWVDDFDQIIARARKEPCKLTKEECIQLLRLAQASHAGDNATDYDTIQWNYRWFETYEKIIRFMEKE